MNEVSPYSEVNRLQAYKKNSAKSNLLFCGVFISCDVKSPCANPEFYLIKHFAHFVKSGAVLLSCSGEMSSNTTAFRNPDGSIAAVILNPFEAPKTVTVHGKNLTLKPRSFNSIV